MGAKVLLLDDDVAFALEIKAALADAGCAVEVLREGNAGLARAVSSHFDLIVASVELPGMNGFRLVNRLKKDRAGHGAPIFLVSAQPSAVFDEHRKLATRAESYFQKPIIIAELMAQIRASVPALGGGPSEAPVEARDDEWTDFIDAAFGSVVQSDGSSVLAPPADESSSMLDRLRSRLAEHEETNVRLLQELGEARALAERATAARAEAVLRLEREIGHWKDRALNQAAPGSSISPGAIAHDELALRQEIVRKNARIARLTQELDQAADSSRELKEKVSRLEGDIPVLKEALENLGRQNAEIEKVLVAARADKEQAARRALDVQRRFERVRPDIEQAEQALEHERAARAAEAAENARALGELTAQREAERSRTERLRAEETAARDAAHAREAGDLRSAHESAIRALQSELSVLRIDLETARNEAGQREQAHREELLRESRGLRAEHVEALAVAEHALEHKVAVLRHEFEAAHAKVKEQASRGLQEAHDKLAEHARSAKRAADAEERFASELAEARRRKDAAEQAFDNERASRGEDEAAHAAAMAEVNAQRDRERLAAEEGARALRAEASETLAARVQAHRQEIQRLVLENERGVATLRRELADAEGRRKAELETIEAARTADHRAHAAEVLRLQAEGERGIAAAEARYEERVAALSRERDAAVQRANEAAREEIRRATESIDAREREIQEAREASEERHRAEKRDLEKANGTLREAFELEKMGRAADAAAHAERLGELARASNAELGQHLDRYRVEQERKTAEIRQQLSAQYKQEGDSERRKHEATVAELRRDVEEAGARGQRQLAAAEVRWRDEKDAAVRAKVVELESSHAQAVLEMQRARSQDIATARQRNEEASRAAESDAAERLQQAKVESDHRIGELERALTESRREREELAESARRHESALESERDVRSREAAQHREEVSSLARRHEIEIGEARERVAGVEMSHATTLEAREAAASSELERARASHEKAVAALERQLGEARADAERARTDAALFEARLRQAADAQASEMTAANTEALAQAESRFEARMVDLARRKDEQLGAQREDYERRVAALEADLERAVSASRNAALESEERALREADLAKTRDAAVAEKTAHLERELGQRGAELAAERADRAREMAEISRANEEALAVAVRRASQEAKEAADERFEREVGQAMIELRTELEVERAQMLGQMERSHSGALRRVMENGERERESLSSRVAELTRALSSLQSEAASLATGDRESGASASLSRMEALARSRAEDVVRLERALDEAVSEVPALEAEVAAFRTELTSLRLQLDDQTVLVGVAKEELLHERERLDNAERALAAALRRVQVSDAPSDR